MRASTGLPVRQDAPRSPWASWPIQRPYCTYQGWSSPKKRFSSATMAGLAMASAPIICSTTVPGIRRSIRNTSTVSPSMVAAMEYSRMNTYRPIAMPIFPRAPGAPRSARIRGPPPTGRGLRRLPGRLRAERRSRSGLVEPDALEPVEQGHGVLAPALHRGLGEVDGVGGEEPEMWDVLQDHDLEPVVDLLSLLLVHGA